MISHNIETVLRLSPKITDRRASYGQSLGVLKKIKEIITKSSIMLVISKPKRRLFRTPHGHHYKGGGGKVSHSGNVDQSIAQANSIDAGSGTAHDNTQVNSASNSADVHIHSK